MSSTFTDLKLSKPLLNAIADLGFDIPTPIQEEAFSVIRSGKDVVGIAQTGTGKTLAYMLPILEDLKFSKDIKPRVLILVPTRELVLQVVEQVESYAKYKTVRTLGVYGGTNIKTQKNAVVQGIDILVATPGRLRDLALSGVLRLKDIKKLVIDEVDVMLDLGFRPQLTNILEMLPDKRQNIMFSATMTDEVEDLIYDFFTIPEKVSIAVSGTPLENIEQCCYPVQNFYTKINLLANLISDPKEFSKVLVFVSTKKHADRVFNTLAGKYESEMGVIHSNKSQNYRIRSIENFDSGTNRILIATDVMARGLDLDKITHVINFDTPKFPENYMHRIGRTGRAEEPGKSILFYTEAEEEAKEAIESLMDTTIPKIDFPTEVYISEELIPEEMPPDPNMPHYERNTGKISAGPAFHEKKKKNKKVNLGSAHKRKMAAKHKKPLKRGDKALNKRKKR